MQNRDSKDDLMDWVKNAMADPNVAITKQDLENYNKENIVNDNFARKSLISTQHKDQDSKDLIKKKL